MPGNVVIKQLDTLPLEEAASLWNMFLTRYGSPIDDAQIQPEEFVLVSAASSSTGIAAIQIANIVEAIPIALTRTSANRQQLINVRAKHVVASRKPIWNWPTTPSDHMLMGTPRCCDRTVGVKASHEMR